MNHEPIQAVCRVEGEASGPSDGSSHDEDATTSFREFIDQLRSMLPRWTSGSEASSGELPTVVDEAAAAGGLGVMGRFELRRELGRGGGGIVLMAVDPSLRRTVALKVPGPEALVSAASRERFLREARAVAALQHPNIVTIHEAGSAGPIPYIVMDYCEGGSLADWLSRRAGDRPVPPRWAARLVAQIAEGIQHAHDQGILHRDLKPSNILLQAPPNARSARREGEEEILDDLGDRQEAPDVVPKVADFGLAKLRSGDETLRDRTVPGLPLGTLPYMASEAARGDGAAIGPATDVYGLGVILFELLTGRRPFEGPDQAALLEQVLHAEAPSPRAFRHDLPIDLATICRKCLEKAGRDRYQSPSEVANELRRFLGGLPILARPAPLWRRSLARARRHPIRSTLAGLALASIIAGTAAWQQFRDLKRRGEIDVLLNNLESASVGQFPELIPRIDPADARVADRLGRLFDAGTPPQKLAASLVLARSRSDCRAHAYARLLRAEPREIPPLARLLRERMPDLASRLAADEALPPAPGTPEPDAEAHDRRRAHAAAALLALDDERGWSLLRFAPDPQARSFLIHLLGPAGIDPARLATRLEAEPDATIRRALIQALGEVPDGMRDDLRRRVVAGLIDLYRDDPDAGVHGSAKWLLRRWRLGAEVDRVDRSLAGKAGGPRSSWRIGPSGLTFIRIDTPALDRVIEVSDTEVTVELYRQFRPDHPYVVEVSPEPDSPMNSVNYSDAAAFCNWLSARERVAADQLCYRPVADVPGLWAPVADHRDLAGYRLPTDIEFELACRAGTTTTRYHGDSASMLAHYARYDQRNGMASSPVARYKPNDLGLFDMLGNAYEVCQSTSRKANPRNQATLCGGCWVIDDIDVKVSSRFGPIDSNAPNIRGISDRFGFRLARTIRKERPAP